MKQRVITAVVALLLLIIVLFAVPPVVAQVVITAVILAGAWEWSAFLWSVRQRRTNRVRWWYRSSARGSDLRAWCGCQPAV